MENCFLFGMLNHTQEVLMPSTASVTYLLTYSMEQSPS